MFANGDLHDYDEADLEPGRPLTDSEYSRALAHRSDIFFVDRGIAPRIIVCAALVFGVGAGLAISRMHPQAATGDFLKRYQRTLSAHLFNSHRLPAESSEQENAEPGPEPMRPSAVVNATEIPRSPLKTQSFARNKPAPKSLLSITRVLAKSVDTTRPAASTPTPSVPAQAVNVPREDQKAAIDKGIVLEKQGKHTDAIDAFKSVLLRDPHNSNALGGVGDVFLHIGFLDSAKIFYDSALAANPRNAPVHNGMGSVRYYLSDMAANVHWAKRMNITNPRQYIKEQFDSAVIEYTRAFSLDSTYVEALTNRGVLRDIHGQADSAIADYTLAIRINPSYADALCKRAAVYKDQHKYKDAIADYTTAIKLGSSSYVFDPQLHYANAYFGRAMARHITGDLGGAISDFDSCLALEPNHSLAILNRAITYADNRQLDSAIAGYTKAISMLSPLEYNGAQGLAYLHRGTAYKNLGTYDAAIADYSKALSFARFQVRSCWRLAECYSLKRDKPGAIEWLRKAASYGFSDFDSWKRDKDLEDLWKDKEFLEIIGAGNRKSSK